MNTLDTGGWHHVEVHPDAWWIRKFESYGFKYDQELTDQVRLWAGHESNNATNIAPNGQPYGPQHLIYSLKIFVNPAVASLPQHQHLFPRHGCFLEWNTSVPAGQSPIINRPCGEPGHEESELETVLPETMQPLPVLPEMHQRWHDAVKKSLEEAGAAMKQ
jgi:hypothetical protein